MVGVFFQFIRKKSWLIFFALIILYLANIYIGIFLPVQTDEIAYYFTNNRAIIDDFNRIGLIPSCGQESFSRPLPFIFYPVALFNHITYAQFDNPLYIRFAGIAHFFVWTILLMLIARKLYEPILSKERLVLVYMLILAFLSHGTMPFLYLVARPEQILLIGTTGLIALFVHSKYFTSSLVKKIIASFLFFFLFTMMHYTHPNSIVFVPIQMVVSYYLFNQLWSRKSVSYASCLLVFITGLFILADSSVWLGCEDENLIKFTNKYLLPLNTLFENPLEFFVESSANFVLGLLLDLNLDFHFGFNFIGWLPQSLSNNSFVTSFSSMLAFIVYGIKICTFFYLLKCSWKAILLIKDKKSKSLHFLFLSVFITFVGLIAMKGSYKLWYYPALAVPLLLFATLIAARIFINNFSFVHKKIYIMLLILAFINLPLLALRYVPLVKNPTVYEDYHKVPFFSAIAYQDRKEIIREAGKVCKINNSINNKHIILDDSTYMQFKDTYQPFYYFWTVSNFTFDIDKYHSPDQVFPMFKNYGSDGLIVDCRVLPESFRPFATETKGYCCIPKTAWSEQNK